MLIRLSIIICCLLPAVVIHAAEISPQRLALLRGTILLVEGNPDALADLRQAAQFSREDWRCQMLYGEALALAGQPIFAKAQLRRAALLAPWRPEPWQAIIRMGRANGDLFLEYAGFAGLLRIFPGDPIAQYRMTFLCRMLGKPADAERSMANWQASLPPMQLDAAHPNPTEPAALQAALACAEWKAGNGEAAHAALTRLHQLTPEDRIVQRNLVHVSLVLGRVDDALQLLRTLPPGDDALERTRTAWSLSSGHYADAIHPLRSLLKRSPTDALLHYQLGAACYLTGDVANAVAELQTAWTQRPDDRIAQLYIAALLAAGRAQEAEALLLDAQKKFPKETILSVILIAIYRESGRPREAAELTNRLAQQRPETMELLVLAGERYLAAKDTEQAKSIAKRLRDLYPTDIIAVHGAITLYRMLELTADASVALTRYLGPNVASPYSRSELLCEVARYAIEDHSLVEAEAALEDVIRTEPGYRPAYVLLGKVYQQQGASVHAAACYLEARTRWPQDAEFSLNLGRMARKSGDLLLAIDAYRTATTLMPSAEPWLELGEVYHGLGDLNHARECWLAAARCPSGMMRAQLSLLTFTDDAIPDEAGKAALTRLLQMLVAERAAREKRWQAELSSRGLTASADELQQLLLLVGDLADPTPLQAWRDALDRDDQTT